MTLYLLTQSLLPHAGTYRVQKITSDQAADMIHQAATERTLVNQVTYRNTRDALEYLSGVQLAGVRSGDRAAVALQDSDQMLIVRLLPRARQDSSVAVRDLEFLHVRYTDG